MESNTKGAAASEADVSNDNLAASGSSGRKRKTRPPDVVEPRTPLKRQRVPVSRFQSPLEDSEPKFKSEVDEKKKEENINLYKKGAFLAVRGAEGTFYLCRTAQNVYSKSRRLKIQWLSVDTPPNDYKFDYVDSTEMETVLTEIKMDKISRDSYRLPVNEKKRIETILDRALRVEKGIATADEVEEEAMEDAKDQDKDTEDEEENDDDESPKSRKRSPKAQKAKRSTGPAPAQKKKWKEKEKVLKEKKKAKVKATKQKSKGRGPDRNLKPNPKIKVLEKDPFFETKEKTPEISALMTSKLAFRALNTDSIDDLKALLEKTEGVTNFEVGRSAHDIRNVLEMAGQHGKEEFVKLLSEEIFNQNQPTQRKRKAPPAPIISSFGTGSYNPVYLGLRAIRSLNVSRGNKEGNDAFLKEEQFGSVDPDEIIKQWMGKGVPEKVIETFLLALSVAEENTRDEQLHKVIEVVSTAIRGGHYKLAAKYVAEAERLGGFGFNYLHKEVLSFEKEDLRDIILAASVRKKPFSNDAITPLHCAAINPNVKYLTRLLSIEPDINLQTRSRARPIHFAAVCEGTAPLEFLLKRNASPNEADSSGNLPIHYASQSGRSKNIDVLLKHAKANEALGMVSEKWGLGNVNRPNRFAMCPLHMAVEEGHLDAVRTLIKYGADVNKSLSAGKDKITPLMIAAQRGDLTLARNLIQSGAAVEILDKMKRSALTHAIMNGNTNVASYLLYLGADPNRVDSSNNTLVHYAAAYGWHFCLKLLIKDAGAKPDEPNIWQTTPIGIAFLKGNYGLVEALFQNKDVNIDFKTDEGMTLASTACKSRLVPGLDNQIKSLVQNFKADPTIKDVNGFNALHHLAANDIKVKGSNWNRKVDTDAMKISVKIAETLIAAGCDPTLRTNEGKTPTMLAIEQVNVDLVRFLVENGGTVSPDKNASEKTVLHLMAEHCCTTNLTPMLHILAGHAHIVSAVEEDPKPIKENGKVNNVDHLQGKKPPVVSMEVDGAGEKSAGDGAENSVLNGKPQTLDAKGDKASTSKVLKETSTPSQVTILKTMAKERDFVGFTPFLRACHVYKTFKANLKDDEDKAQHAREFIQALLELTESDVNAVVGPKNMPDEPEEHYAPEGKMSALHMLVNVVNEEESKIGAGMSILLRFTANPNQKDKDGKTPLVLAVEGSREKIVKLLLENGADPNVDINHGYYRDTPLVLATNRGSLQIMRMLIQYKAEVTRYRSDDLSTPLHLMVTNRVHEDETIAMLQLLLQNGAKINSVDVSGNTPLHLAVSGNKGHSDTSTSLEEFLLESGADMMAKDHNDNMPLHLALDKNGTDPIELCSLLTSMMRDQRVDEPNKRGYTPLLFAASSGATICCMHLLQRGANLEAREFRGNTPLNVAIYGGYDSCAIMLMQRNASLNFPIVVSLPHTLDPVASETEEERKKKKRPLLNWRPKLQWQCRQPRHFPGETMTIFEGAVKKDLTGVAHMLLDGLGMPMEAVEAALNLSKFYLALRLIRRIPDISRLHAKNKEGQNLFHVLANKTSRNDPDLQLKVAAALLEKRIPLGECDKHGATPLMYAALKHQSVKLAKFLIDYDRNFNPQVKDNRKRDIMAAFMWDYSWISDNFKLTEVKEWMDTLIDQGGVSLDTLYDHPLPDPLLLGAKVSSPQPDFFDTTQAGPGLTSPLIFAIRNYNFGLAKFMLQKGASPNFPDGDGITPMMHAVQMNDVMMVKLLLNPEYEGVQGYMQEQTSLKPQLSHEQSRQVMTINFEIPAKDNPDDILDEEAEEDDDEDKVSLSKHTEENEDSVDLEDEDEEPEDDEPEDDMSEHGEDDDAESYDKGDSDHDTDIVDDEPEEIDEVESNAGDEEKPSLPGGAMKLTLTRHVSQITKERVYISVPKTSSVDLSKADPKGWTSLHHAVCPLAAATFDNTEIIFLLCKAGAPLEVKNKDGETPADLARKHNAEKIFRQLQKLGLQADKPFVKSPEGFCVDDCVSDKTKPDIQADEEAMLTKLDAAAGVVPDSGDSPRVDNNCEIKKAGEVAQSETNIPYNVTLSKVDVTCGTWGMYNFYKLQIVQHTAKKLFILFTRWGRIGDRGQFQHTPFQTLAEAAKEFCKIYKSKTGNDWNQTTGFKNHPKKYRLMPKPEKQHKQHRVDFNFESSIPSKLPEAVFDLLSELSSVNMLEASIKKVGLDEDFMPFGRMKRETLLDARRVLTEISELIEKVVKLRNNLTAELHAEYQSNCEEIAKLTNEYYHLVPIFGYECETVQPIAEKKMLRDHTKLLADLMDLQVANKMLLGANLRKSEMNPMDYIYFGLGCRIQPIAEDDPQTQFILTNIHASAPSARINRVFKVAREGEAERLAALNMPNHKLLWHGSSMSNFISILSRGLLVTPPEVPWTGHLFGEGIYFADTFVKSANYCHNHSNKSTCKVMLLCEVALGNPKVDVKHGDEDHLDDDINSLKILGLNAPISDFDALLPFGATLSLGQIQPMKYHPPARITHNEYIIHNAEQVAIRYLVLFNG